LKTGTTDGLTQADTAASDLVHDDDFIDDDNCDDDDDDDDDFYVSSFVAMAIFEPPFVCLLSEQLT
jgi:hypothetical protein